MFKYSVTIAKLFYVSIIWIGNKSYKQSFLICIGKFSILKEGNQEEELVQSSKVLLENKNIYYLVPVWS